VVSVGNSKFSDAAGNFNVDGSDTNNTVTMSVNAVAAAAKSNDPALQDASTRLLGIWMTPDAAPVLLELSKGPQPLLEQVAPGLLLLSGHYRNGVLLAPASADWALRWIEGASKRS
jgi:glycine/D-amino acid oxidase-like deaminating enzyme